MGETRTKTKEPGSDKDKESKAAKRRKVSRACLFCKRSHMTCTENRPCDRCIKRDIAHLCTDTVPGEGTPLKNKEGSASDALNEDDETSFHFGSDAGGTEDKPEQLIQPPPASAATISPDPPPATIAAPSASSFPLQSPTSLLISPPPLTHHDSGSNGLSRNGILGPMEDGSDQAHIQDHRARSDTSSTSQHTLPSDRASTQTVQGTDGAASNSSNPFALLNQAYDFSYPSNAGLSNNSLASLRLFATTADAQFGHLGPANQAAYHHASSSSASQHPNGGISLLGSGLGAKAHSDAGTGSDIDSNALDDFLRSLDEMYLNPLPDLPQAFPTPSSAPLPLPSNQVRQSSLSTASPSHQNNASMPQTAPPSRSMSPILGGEKTATAGTATPSSSTERFLLTAADQKEGTRDERLNRVIRAKYEAGLLKPFNYIKGYERLNTWMDNKWSSSSKHRTLKIISEFRPAFRAIAQSLTDMDLIYIEEAFERLLLDYDRVFSTMGIPACLWRRTGEIFKGNREFAELVGIPYEQLRDGKLAISELMAEDSAVNFWEKYGSIAFDPGQKAVLTSCVLVNQAVLRGEEERKNSRLRRHSSNNQSASAFDREDFLTPSSSYPPNVPKEALITCTFSFTIRRDAYHIPTAIVGNFMPYKPK